MEIKNSFEVPLPPARAWTLLMDIPRIVPCMPGAELVEQIDERTYKGRVAVKLGPVALAFAGTAKFEELDEAGGRARVKAAGADAKGRGSANATVSFALVPVPAGTRVDVVTDVALAGSIAQYGRGAGIIQSVATQLIGQFASCLEASVRATASSSPPPEQNGEVADATSAGGPPAPPAPPTAKPISVFSLLFSVVRDAVLNLFRRR